MNESRISELEAENARLRELACWQEDDAEPVTVEWFQSIGGNPDGDIDGEYGRLVWFPDMGDEVAFDNTDDHMQVTLGGDGKVWLEPYNCAGMSLALFETGVTTRGQLRRLIAALEGK